ncbi:MAG: hypothetical protein ACOY0T_07665 [Myxococcota bacterium]
MDSARSFVRLWLLLTAAVLGYAWIDFRLTPRLHAETHYSMRPDLSQLPDLLHWGGRLFHHRELYLLIGNAVVLGGMGALLGRGLVRFTRRARERSREPEVSIVPGPPPTSVPPAPR